MPQPLKLQSTDTHWHLDCLGLLCPVPIVQAGRAMRSLAGGDLLVIEADDPGAELDLQDWAEANRHPWEGCDRDGERSVSRVRKRA